jgi:hypothetical protein
MNLATHIKKNHNFNQRCGYVGCTDQRVYTSADKLRDHREHHIYKYSKFTCPVGTCPKHKKPLATDQSLRTHMTGMHDMSAAAASVWNPEGQVVEEQGRLLWSR